MELSRRAEDMLRLLLLLVIICCLLLTPTTAFTHFSLHRTSSIHTVAKKRGNMDLAFIQMYQLCDRDRNGFFAPQELQCLSHMLHLLIGGRVK